MNYSVYRVKSKKLTGMMFLYYQDGKLTQAIVPEVEDANMVYLPTTEHELRQNPPIVPGSKSTVQPLALKTAHEKIQMFCAAHQARRGVYYIPKKHEKSNIKTVQVTPELLDVFFKSPHLQHFTIDNYVSRINITRDWAKNGIPDGKLKSKHPDYYDKDHERKLTGSELVEYHQHLYKCGWQKIHPEAGGTVWREKMKG